MAHAPYVRPLFGFNGKAPREDTGSEVGLVPRARVTLNHWGLWEQDDVSDAKAPYQKVPSPSPRSIKIVNWTC